ncbi:hypothetical protein BDQ17DRAFT_1359281 [Cyathus striatus]|nr:hypothetical protein BDQ17DRAFT_1359281 [Cyathus striatus]
MAHLMAAGSAPDLKSPYVIKRKPPPSINLTERYPAPDPSDPFAPLWVLRHRTSSALHGPLDLPSPLDSRQRSNSTFNRSAALAPSSNAASSTTFLPITAASQDIHYRLRSQSTVLSPTVTNLTSPRSGHAFIPQRSIANKVHDSDTSGTESDTLVQKSRKHSSPSIRRRSSSAQHRFARLLRSKRSGSIDAKGQGAKATELARVRKGSISGPVVSTVVWSTGGQGFVSIHKNPVYKAAVPVLGNSVTIDTYSPQPTPDASLLVSKDQLSGGNLRRGHSHTPISVPPESSFLKKRRLSSIHLPLANRGHDTSHTSSFSPQRNLRKSVSLAHDGISSRPNAMEPSISLMPPTILSSEWELPTQSQLSYAASLPIISEKGKTIPFGSIFSKMRTIVVFIRHFWCPNCQDYMSSLTSFARPEVLQAQSEKGGEVQLVIISNGAHTFIKKYRRIFRLPFRVYTDPTLGVYSALGMGKVNEVSTTEFNKRRRKMSLDESKLPSARRGEYAKHGLMSGIAMVVVRALKVGIPLWEKGGDVSQLGGEFVLGPGMTCSYAHRMQSTRGHAPVEDVLYAAYGSESISAPILQQVVAVPNGCAMEGAPCNSVGFPYAHRIRRRPEHIKMPRTHSTKVHDGSAVVPRQFIDRGARVRQEPTPADITSTSMVSSHIDEKRPKKLPRIPVQKVLQVDENLPDVERGSEIHGKEAKVALTTSPAVTRHSIDSASRPRQEAPVSDVPMKVLTEVPVEDTRPKQLPSIPDQKAVQAEEKSVNVEINKDVDVKVSLRQLPEVPRASPKVISDASMDITSNWEVVAEHETKRLADAPTDDRYRRVEAPVIEERDISISTICTTGSDIHEAVVQPTHEDKVTQDRLLPDLPSDAGDDHAVKL